MNEIRLRREGIAWSDLGSEVVILDLRSSTYFSARDSGAFLVNALVDGASATTLVERLLGRYEADTDTVRADVDEFLGELARRDLIEPVDG